MIDKEKNLPNISPKDLERAQKFANENSTSPKELIKQMCQMVYLQIYQTLGMNAETEWKNLYAELQQLKIQANSPHDPLNDQELSNMKNELSGNKEHIERLKRESQKFEGELKNLNDELDDQRRADAKLKQMEATLREMENKYGEHEREIARLDEGWSMTLRKEDELKNILERCKERIYELKGMYGKIYHKGNEIENAKSNLSILALINKQINILENELNAFEKSLRGREYALNKENRGLPVPRSLGGKSDDDETALKKKIDYYTERIELDSRKLISFEAQYGKGSSEVVNLIKQIDDAKNKRDEFASELQGAENEIKELKRKISDKQAALEKKQSQFRMLESLQEEINALKKKLKEFRNKVESSKSDKIIFEEEIKNLKSKLEKKMNKLKSTGFFEFDDKYGLKQDIANYNTELKNEEKSLQECISTSARIEKMEIPNLDQEIKKKEAEFSKKEKEIRLEMLTVPAWQNLLKETELEYQRLQDELRTLMDELVDLESKNAQLESQIEQNERDKNEKYERKNSLEGLHSEPLRALSRLRREIKDAPKFNTDELEKKKIPAIQGQISKCKDEIHLLKKKMEKIESDISHKEAALRTLDADKRTDLMNRIQSTEKRLNEYQSAWLKKSKDANPLAYWIEFETLMTSINPDENKNEFFQIWKKFILPIRKSLGL